MNCPWCEDHKSEVEEGLCPMHEAELWGMTEAQVQELDYESWDWI